MRREEKFLRDVRRGRRFETEEKDGWRHVPEEQLVYEAGTEWKGKRGRIDIKITETDDSVSLVEVKATDWDRLGPNRVRPTANRHARQIWRYIDDHVELQGREVCPGLVYEHEPANPSVRQTVERILNGRNAQKLTHPTLKN